MKWTIQDTYNGSEKNIVRLSRVGSRLGGIWKSTEHPSELEQYDVEIDIDLPIEKLDPICRDSKTYRMYVEDGKNRITGMIEDVDEEDGLHYLRISVDGIIMIESGGLKLNKGEFYTLSVPFDVLEITPIGRVIASQDI